MCVTQILAGSVLTYILAMKWAVIIAQDGGCYEVVNTGENSHCQVVAPPHSFIIIHSYFVLLYGTAAVVVRSSWLLSSLAV